MLKNEKIASNNYVVFAIPIFTLLSISLYFYSEWISLPASYIQQWGQADWYAISLCYAKENLNIFLPRTYALNTYFVDISKWTEGITSSDFPIHTYIVALIMYGSENFQPIVYRSYTLVNGLIGMFFLYKLIYSSTKSIYWSICCMVLAFCSPVYVYYQVGFQPVAISFSYFIIAVYFLYNYSKNNKKLYFFVGLSFITISSMANPSFATFWIAFFIYYVWNSLKNKHHNNVQYIALFITFVLQLSYILYRTSVKNDYGTIFLDYTINVTSFDSYVHFMSVAWNKWKGNYLSDSQFVLLFILLITVIILIINQKSKRKEVLFSIGLFLTSIASAILFTYFNASQVPDHDYYAIDFMMPILVSFLLLFAELISEIKLTVPLSLSILLACLFFNVSECKSFLDKSKKINKEYITENIKQYFGSEELIENLNISKQAKLLVLNSLGNNMPLLEMERKGYSILNLNASNIIKSLSYPYDYVVISNQDIDHIMSICPLVTTTLQKIGTNSLITIYKKIKNGNILKFYNIDTDKILLNDTTNFDIVKLVKHWNCQYLKFSNKEFFSKPLSLKVDTGDFIGPKLILSKEDISTKFTTLNIILKAKVLFPDETKNIRLAYEVHYANLKTFEFAEIVKKKNTSSNWNEATSSAVLKLNDNKNIKKIVFFLWNPQKCTYFIDDIETYIYAD